MTFLRDYLREHRARRDGKYRENDPVKHPPIELLAPIQTRHYDPSCNRSIADMPCGDYLHRMTVEDVYEIAHNERNSVIRVAASGRHVVGYSIYSLNRSNIAIDRIVVAPEFRGHRVGSML